MKKALLFGLSLAPLLSLAACHKPQVDQPATAATSSRADVSTPEPLAAPGSGNRKALL